MESDWLMEHMPGVLLLPGPRRLLWCQWLASPTLALIAWVLGSRLGYFRAVMLAVLFWALARSIDVARRVIAELAWAKNEETLLAFMAVVEHEETSFAFPTRTIHLVTGQT